MSSKEPVNLIDESGILAISTRLQRLSDQFRKDGLLLYKAFGIEFEPKWFPVIYTLQFKSPLSILELASEIGYAHPSTISLLKELEQQKLISSLRDKTDERKRLIILTGKAWELIEKMKPVWEVMIKVLSEVTQTENKLLQALNETEEQLRKKSFFERAQQLVETMKEQRSEKSSEAAEIEVRLVETTEAFKTSAAIVKSVLRKIDAEQSFAGISDDQNLNFLATVHDLPAGTCSCRKTKTGYKIEGLAVLEQYRGVGVGKALIDKLLVQKNEALEVHSPLALVTWFEKMGFQKKGKQQEESGNLYYKMILSR
ncbi:DNA-binding MarR family transcriptional regulator [Pedobacter cryoconitis]|uniref:bifunctional helix-turn-helix transcriptional regulator/GNAT family N-acetyltransferase n=1 Tax=Pedobacter cryoconitis TaxID=188932 RepID=UPI00160D6E1C|nr:bifunctional helix-turn-helix transcriptional regulator/GNAT family N-acetyltransferase [Pedobacter cryoconitis]MBB6273944.1 DNA-binding MarR family transcriptional regulator [Pedobacter cryoconitis]